MILFYINAPAAAAVISLPDFNCTSYTVPLLAGVILFAAFICLLCLYFKFKNNIKTSELDAALKKLEASEEKNCALLAVNPDPLFIFDSDYNFIDYKAESENYLFAPPSEFIGKNIADVLPPDIVELTIKMIEKTRMTGLLQSFEFDMEIYGRKRSFESRLIKFGEDKFMNLVRNISVQKKRDEEVTRMHKLESLEIFAGGIANDFNNILSAIAGNISLACTKIDNREKSISLLEEAEKAVLRAGHLTEQLLAFSKGGTPVKQVADLKDIVMESADFIMSGSKTAINYNIEQDVSKCEIDKGQIVQAVQNIILNASQAMPSGGYITISILNKYMDDGNPVSIPEGDYVAVEIKDEGRGIEKKNLNKIFDPYFTTKSNSNGLGLTICSSIVKRHGGGIDVSSVPGKGSVFTIYLPAFSDPASEKKAIPATDRSSNLRNISILIIDDEPQLRRIMNEVLTDEGAEVFPVSEGGEAIDLFEKMAASGNPVKLIIADLTIPGGMGGMEAIRIMREQGIPFKAVVITGYSNDPVISDYKSYGFDAFLTKPFTSEDLLFTVKKIFEK